MKPRHLLTILALSPQASSLHDAVNYPVDGNVRGLAFADANITSNRYLYNGKELEDYTLGTLDYGARHYDPRIARWTVPDPMAEKYYGMNAYGYCLNNPIRYFDPTGQKPKDVIMGGITADKDDYYYGLQVADITSGVVGVIMIASGEGGQTAGGGLVAVGAGVAATGIGAPEGGIAALVGIVAVAG